MVPTPCPLHLKSNDSLTPLGPKDGRNVHGQKGGGVQILVDRGGMRAYKYHCIGFVSHFVNWLLLIAKNSFLELFLDPPHVQNQPACDNLPLPGLEKSIPNRFCSIVRHHAYHEFQRKHTVILANFI